MIDLSYPPASPAAHAREVEAELLGRRRQVPGAEPSTQEGPRGTGTRASGYLAPQDGPFRCGNCAHFHSAGAANETDDTTAGLCDEPHTVSDPLVRGRVQDGGCCSFFLTLQPKESVDAVDDRRAPALAR